MEHVVLDVEQTAQENQLTNKMGHVLHVEQTAQENQLTNKMEHVLHVEQTAQESLSNNKMGLVGLVGHAVHAPENLMDLVLVVELHVISADQ